MDNKRRLDDRWIAAVGLLVAGAVGALLGVAVFVAHRVDADSAHHEVQITKGHLNAQVARMRQDLASVAHAQNAGQRTIANDLQAIHNDYGKRLHALSGHQLSYILNPYGVPIYASVNGIIVEPSAYITIAPRLEPILEGIRHTFMARNAAAARNSNPAVEFVPEAVSRAVFQRIDHRTALVGAVTLSPRPKPESILDRPPPVAVSVMFLDEFFLHELSIDLSINDLALQNMESSDASRSSVEIPIYSDGQRAWLTWTPGKPGSAMLDRLMPALIGTAAFIGLIGFLVLRHAKRANAFPLLFHDLAAQRVFGLIARNQNSVAWILDIVLQMMQDPSGFTHPGGRNDDERSAKIVQRLRFIYVLNEAEPREAEWILTAMVECIRLRIQRVLMRTENLGGLHSQRAVDENRNRRDSPGIGEFVQQQDQLLGSAERKCRNDDLSSTLSRTHYGIRKLRLDLLEFLVQTIAVGAFHDQVIRLGTGFRIGDDGQFRTPYVTRKAQPERLSVLARFQAP